MGKLTNGPICVGCFKSLYLCAQRWSCELIIREKKNRFTRALLSQKMLPKHQQPPRDQTALNKERHYTLLIAAQASHLLHQSHSCQPWRQTSTLLGAREKVHASFPLNPLALYSSVPDFRYPSLWEFAAGGFQGASVIRASSPPSLSN